MDMEKKRRREKLLKAYLDELAIPVELEQELLGKAGNEYIQMRNSLSSALVEAVTDDLDVVSATYADELRVMTAEALATMRSQIRPVEDDDGNIPRRARLNALNAYMICISRSAYVQGARDDDKIVSSLGQLTERDHQSMLELANALGLSEERVEKKLAKVNADMASAIAVCLLLNQDLKTLSATVNGDSLTIQAGMIGTALEAYMPKIAKAFPEPTNG
jgi:hypothetical protein